MHLTKKRGICLLVVLGLALTCGTGWNARKLETDNIHLRGSGNVALIAQQVAEDYMRENPGVVVTVSSTGTMRGVKSLINGICNVAMASADSDEEQQKHAKDTEIKLTEHVIARDALVPIVNSRNPVASLTVEQLRKLFGGEISNWQQVGGLDEPVLIASHDGFSGNYETWKAKVMQDGRIITPKAKIMATDAMRAYIQQNSGAIGYVGLSQVDAAVKPLAVEGIIAGPDSVKNGKFPILRDLKLYTSQHATASINQFVEYFLAADKGQKRVEQAGSVPVKQ